MAWDFAAKFYLLGDGLTVGRTDGALVRMITPIQPGESPQQAEERLHDLFLEVDPVLNRFVPDL